METVLNVRKCLCKINELVKKTHTRIPEWKSLKNLKNYLKKNRPHKGANVKKKEKS